MIVQADTPQVAARRDGWVRRHPLVSFFVLAYAISWTAWAGAYLGLGSVGIAIGGFGPLVAAWIVTRKTDGSVGDWARQIVAWRVPPRFYLYALGLPALLWVVMNLVLAALGEPVRASLLTDRLPAYLATLLFVSMVGGGFEEPGWRGFALARLELRFRTPVRATLVLAFFWGLWHLPLYGAAFVVPMLYAFFYTYLYNRTRSVLLCIVLHGGFTAALDNLILTPDNTTVDLVILLTLVAATVVLIGLTRGRLGYEGPQSGIDERARRSPV
jgi:membrane protease YdiL (CAAX protease family)